MSKPLALNLGDLVKIKFTGETAEVVVICSRLRDEKRNEQYTLSKHPYVSFPRESLRKLNAREVKNFQAKKETK